ncbi:MAG: phenylalanine--tRNA ligase subunit beta [Saprospiraceae bacterium]|nr:phenylalanine--tRNA ligase subunit beta [Candidatus Opimibacter iunctus]
MTVSLLWLNDYLKISLTPEQVSEALTSLGLEVEKMETWESIKGGLKGIVAGKVLTCVKHPDADRLSVTTVDVGGENPSTIVCGANNIAAGQTVWVALPDTELYDATGKPWTIKVSKIRGQRSEGMICAEDELGLGTSHDGIMILPDSIAAGTKASEYYQLVSDILFEIGLTPNRSDATSVLGVASDLAAFLSVQSDTFHPVTWPAIPEIARPAVARPFKVTVKNAEACPRYSGVLISGITIGPSPDWIKQRLQAIGVKSINNIVDITNFILHEMGQPLHAFDADKITGQEIIVDTKPAGTPFLALDNHSYTLHAEDLMICDGQGAPMCIGGVYGGLHSGVSESTTTIFLESAHFNAGSVRRSSMRHNLRTEAARRFEKGSDPNITLKALARAVDLISSLAGGEVASEVFDLYPQPVLPAKISLTLKTLSAKTGVDFQAAQVEKVLDALQMPFEKKDGQGWTVAVPTNKADVLREIDVIEEVLRVYGFANVPLPSRMHTSIAIEPRYNPHKLRRLIGNFLASKGFLEAMNMSLTQPSYYNNIAWTDNRQWVTIHNTSNESLNLLRPEMLIPTLETVKRNVNRKQEDLRLFEFGKSYGQARELPHETEHLVVTMTGQQHPSGWQTGTAREIDFFSIKALIHSLLLRLGIKSWQTGSLVDADGLAYGFSYSVGPVQFLRFGKVSGELCNRFDIRQDVFFADFLVEPLIALASRSITLYEELNRFPAVVRDLAVVIDDQVTYEAIRQVAIEASGSILTNLEVFDIYKNADHLGEGKMSMALRFTIENKEATLADKEIEQWFNKVQKALVAGVKAEIRK